MVWLTVSWYGYGPAWIHVHISPPSSIDIAVDVSTHPDKHEVRCAQDRRPALEALGDRDVEARVRVPLVRVECRRPLRDEERRAECLRDVDDVAPARVARTALERNGDANFGRAGECPLGKKVSNTKGPGYRIMCE